jgi:hypothetical protein
LLTPRAPGSKCLRICSQDGVLAYRSARPGPQHNSLCFQRCCSRLDLASCNAVRVRGWHSRRPTSPVQCSL